MYLWGVSYQQVEWCFLCRGGWPRVLCILGEGEPFMPVVLLCPTEDAQILFESLIGSLTSSIGLRVIRCADVLMDV